MLPTPTSLLTSIEPLDEHSDKVIEKYELVKGNVGNELLREEEFNQVAKKVKWS